MKHLAMRTHLFRVVLLCLGLFCWLPSPAQGMQQAFLVQNSGWMEPFYTDAKSPFKKLVARTIDAVGGQDDVLTLLAFNQATPGNVSPRNLYQGPPSDESIAQALAGLALARKSPGGGLADTDFNEAVAKTIMTVFRGRPGILWIFTNNKNSPNNSAQTAARNREFYDLVHKQPAITRTLALPLAMPVRGERYTANGLMVYALAYGAEADRHLQALVGTGRLAKLFTQAPAQLKPLDRDAVRFVPARVLDAPGITASLGRDKRTLILDVAVGATQRKALVVAGLENLFYPYTIRSARLSAKIVAKNGAEAPLAVAPTALADLGPGKAVATRVLIPINVTRPSPWSLSGLLQFGRSIVVPAVIVVRLDEQKLALDPAFRLKMQQVFPGDPLPDVFTPPEDNTVSTGRIPVLVRLNYPLYPLLIALGLLLCVGAGALFVLAKRGVADTYAIIVDGSPRQVSLARFCSVDVYSVQNDKVAVLRRGIGRPEVRDVAEGHSVNLVR